jgi:biopolymer transport protein ExbB
MLVETLFNATLVGAEWVLYLLIGLSIISVAIMVERSITLIRSRINPLALQNELRTQLDKGNIKAAIAGLQGHNAAEARICLSGLMDMQKGIGAVEENIAAATNVEKDQLEKNLAFLGTVGSNAPFIGLFGTVLGIIKAFHDLSLGSNEGASAVMSGVSEALVATAVGLMVAIPAVVAFNVFKRKVSRRLSNADTLSRVLFAHIKSN